MLEDIVTAYVFVWEMYKQGVGHASMFIEGSDGAYISWWPTEAEGIDRALKAVYSPGLVHSMQMDKKTDGVPDYCSSPIRNLDEKAIIATWKAVASNPNLRTHAEAAKSGNYIFATNNCATTVMRSLLLGADEPTSGQIYAYLAERFVGTPGDGLARAGERVYNKVMGDVGSWSAVGRAVGEAVTQRLNRTITIAPYDCRQVAERIWGM